MGGEMAEKEKVVEFVYCVVITLFATVFTSLLLSTENLFWLLMNSLMCLKAIIGYSAYQEEVEQGDPHSVRKMLSRTYIRFY